MTLLSSIITSKAHRNSATIAMVVSWTLIGYGRAVAWELPILGADFTLWRIILSLPIPILAGALGRLVYVRMYPKGGDE